MVKTAGPPEHQGGRQRDKSYIRLVDYQSLTHSLTACRLRQLNDSKM